jgi:peptidoglycan/xylan/chitin deacetylase (PgdA/CDA1 family)
VKRAYPILGTAVVFAVVYGLCRIFIHSSALLTPAVITPQMDAHSMIAPALDARVKRLLAEMQPHSPMPTQRLIALTFDDGPYAVDTPLLLDQLKDLDVPATFFLIGRDAEEQPELTARIIAAGFEVGDHTRSHPNLDELSPTEVNAELLAGSGILQRFTSNKSPRIYFRPPHGRYTEQTLAIAQNLGYTTVLWNDDAGDWKVDDPQVLTKHIEEHAMSPEILLLHSGRMATIQMLAQIVPAFRSAGYRFVTVSELFKEVPPDEVNHARRFNVEQYLVAHPTSTDAPTQ